MRKEHVFNETVKLDATTNRIEAFSDGVFAIVMTLLVLELAVPVLNAPPSEQEARKALLELVPKFISYVLSFLIVAIYWVNHHQFFLSLKRSDPVLLWLNIHLLFWVSFIPFPTAFIGEYYTLKTGVILFAVVNFMGSVAFYMMQHYSHFRGKLHKGISEELRMFLIRKSLIGPLFYGISVAAAFYNERISIAIFFIVPLIYFMPKEFLKPDES